MSNDLSVYQTAKDLFELKAECKKRDEAIKMLVESYNKLFQDNKMIGEFLRTRHAEITQLRADVDNLMNPKEEPVKEPTGEERLKKQFKANTDQK